MFYSKTSEKLQTDYKKYSCHVTKIFFIFILDPYSFSCNKWGIGNLTTNQSGKRRIETNIVVQHSTTSYAYRGKYRRLVFKSNGNRDRLLFFCKRALRKQKILNNITACMFRLRWPIMQFDFLEQLTNERTYFFSIVFNGCVIVIKMHITRRRATKHYLCGN